MKTVQTHSKFFIIGNADEQNSIAHLIQDDDIVVRFNNPNPNCTLKADWIFIANGYTQIRHLVIEHQFLKPETQIFFRYSKEDIFFGRYQDIPLHKRIKYLWRFPQWIKKLNLNLYQCKTFPLPLYSSCVNLINHKLPSTGLLAIYYVLTRFPNNKIFVHNFTHSGWIGHNWVCEKKLLNNWEANKKIINL